MLVVDCKLLKESVVKADDSPPITRAVSSSPTWVAQGLATLTSFPSSAEPNEESGLSEVRMAARWWMDGKRMCTLLCIRCRRVGS